MKIRKQSKWRLFKKNCIAGMAAGLGIFAGSAKSGNNRRIKC